MKNALAIVVALLALITCKVALAETPETKESSALAHARPVKRTVAQAPETTTVKRLACKSRVTHVLVQQGTGPGSTVTVCEM